MHALRRQTFSDFEVVVSDNAIKRPLDPSPELFDGERFRYVRPPRSMWMTDHWEFALAHARGAYVGVHGDKARLVPTALEQVAAVIRRDAPDAVSWRHGSFRPVGASPEGAGEVTVPRSNLPPTMIVSPAEALEYLLATYLQPNFAADHQMEIRGSIYHGVFSTELLAAMRARFGRVFRFYAPDLNAQCAALQLARTVVQITRPLELTTVGPSNGVASGTRASVSLDTQREAAQGDSGVSSPLIPGLTVSISHVLAADLAAISGRTLSVAQLAEVHRRAAYDLHMLEDWPESSQFEAQKAVLWRSAARLGKHVRLELYREKWRARRVRWKRIGTGWIEERLGPQADVLRALRRGDQAVGRRRYDGLREALEALR